MVEHDHHGTPGLPDVLAAAVAAKHRPLDHESDGDHVQMDFRRCQKPGVRLRLPKTERLALSPFDDDGRLHPSDRIELDGKRGFDIQSVELSGVPDGMLEEGSGLRRGAGCRLFHLYIVADDPLSVETTKSCLKLRFDSYIDIIAKWIEYFAIMTSLLDFHQIRLRRIRVIILFSKRSDRQFTVYISVSFTNDGAAGTRP
ncbi:hypothetical protein [Lichenibacterium minor]|uniref:hypothetical protein n=1 Tax=Lichenibacterium minor TaxID=2316528 RepID=UPI0013EBD95C|nr:hypothetical protein [Lichenibacterium minor]